MLKLYEYRFEVKHDGGTFFTGVIAQSKKSAIETICKRELCPQRAVKYIRKQKLNIN